MNVTPAEGTDIRSAAMKFYATLRTAAELRAQAADPQIVAAIAGTSREAEDEVRAMMLDLADGIDGITAQGLTVQDCWQQLGWSPEFVASLLAAEDGPR